MATKISRSIRLATVLGFTLAALTSSAQAQEIINKGAVTGLKGAHGKNNNQIDFTNAKVLALPKAPDSVSVQADQDLVSNLVNRFQSSAATDGGQVAGFEGDGATNAVELGAPSVSFGTQEGMEVEPQQFGTSNHPFTTARADLSVNTNMYYPYRASGKLFFNIDGSTYVCSASLIKRGVVVTAAHCVSQYGARRFYTNFSFVPGYRNGVAPYRVWTASTVWVMSGYFTGTAGQCAAIAPGVVCKDDVAVIELTPQTNPTYPGTSTGWYGYGWNRWGFTSAGLTHITQTGYPVALDNGRYMQRNDSQGFIASSSLMNNTIIGSLMTGGSSGGPWLNNFGFAPMLYGISFGSFSTPNIVVGVTSWGYGDSTIKQQGASPFTSTNIVPLVNAACADVISDKTMSPSSNPRCL